MARWRGGAARRYDERMAAAFGEGYYQTEEAEGAEVTKPEFGDLEEELQADPTAEAHC